MTELATVYPAIMDVYTQPVSASIREVGFDFTVDLHREDFLTRKRFESTCSTLILSAGIEFRDNMGFSSALVGFTVYQFKQSGGTHT